MSSTTLATDYVDWASLGKVAGVSLIFGVGIVVLFSVGVYGLSMARGRTNDDSTASSAQPTGRGLGTAVAAVCFVICAVAVAYGLYLIVPQFH